MSREPRLAVLETAEWYKRDPSLSTKAFFHVLGQFLEDNPNDFVYSTFINRDSLLSTLKHCVSKRGVRYIHVTCHGNEKELAFNSSYTKIRNILKGRTKSTDLGGIFFGACDFGHKAEKFLDPSEGVPVKWAAGYRAEVDWLEAAAFELLFWGKLLDLDREQNQPAGQAVPTLKKTIAELKVTCGMLMGRLKFSAYIQDRGKPKNIA